MVRGGGGDCVSKGKDCVAYFAPELTLFIGHPPFGCVLLFVFFLWCKSDVSGEILLG